MDNSKADIEKIKQLTEKLRQVEEALKTAKVKEEQQDENQKDLLQSKLDNGTMGEALVKLTAILEAQKEEKAETMYRPPSGFDPDSSGGLANA